MGWIEAIRRNGKVVVTKLKKEEKAEASDEQDK